MKFYSNFLLIIKYDSDRLIIVLGILSLCRYLTVLMCQKESGQNTDYPQTK